MNRALLAFFAALGIACASVSNDNAVAALRMLPPLGSKFTPRTIRATVLGQHVYAVEVNHILFSVSVSPSTRRVLSILTRDTHFRTPEGISVGSSLSAVSSFGAHWRSEPLACYYLLPSGWEALVPSPTLDAPVHQSHVPSATPAPGQSSLSYEVPTASCPPTSGSVQQLTLHSRDGA